MAATTKRPLATWAPVFLACVIGCATETQGDGILPGPLGESGSGGAAAGTAATDGGSSAGTMTAAGTPAGGTSTQGGTAPSGGTFATAGFTSGGTFGTGGTDAGGTASGGGGAGGTSAGAGGKGGSGGAGGTGGAAGAGGKGGSGGTAGAGGSGTGCAAHPIGAKATWMATANVQGDPCTANETVYCGPASYAVDGTTGTRFTTVAARTGQEWLQIDFGTSVTVSQLVLHTAAGSSDYTHGYEVRMSASAADIAASPAIVTGTGMAGDTTITFPSRQTGQFLRLSQTTAIAGWWSIQEIDASCQ